MKEAIQQQQREVEKAVIGYGEYKLRTQYSSLTVSVEKWFRMSQEQRQRYITKLNTTRVIFTVDQQYTSASNTIIEEPSTSGQESASACKDSHSSSTTVADITIGRFSDELLQEK